MVIKKIQVENLRYNSATDSHSAIVILTTDQNTICLTGRTALSPSAPRADIRTALVADALRQVRQLPEFRSGAHHLTLDVAIGRPGAPQARQSA